MRQQIRAFLHWIFLVVGCTRGVHLRLQNLRYRLNEQEDDHLHLRPVLVCDLDMQIFSVREQKLHVSWGEQIAHAVLADMQDSSSPALCVPLWNIQLGKSRRQKLDMQFCLLLDATIISRNGIVELFDKLFYSSGRFFPQDSLQWDPQSDLTDSERHRQDHLAMTYLGQSYLGPVLLRPILLRPGLLRPKGFPGLLRPVLLRPVLLRPVLLRPGLLRPGLLRPKGFPGLLRPIPLGPGLLRPDLLRPGQRRPGLVLWCVVVCCCVCVCVCVLVCGLCASKHLNPKHLNPKP